MGVILKALSLPVRASIKAGEYQEYFINTLKENLENEVTMYRFQMNDELALKNGLIRSGVNKVRDLYHVTKRARKAQNKMNRSQHWLNHFDLYLNRLINEH